MSSFDPTLIRPVDGRHATPDQRTTIGEIAAATWRWTTPASFQMQLRDAGYDENTFDPNWRETPDYQRYSNTPFAVNFAGLPPEAASMLGSYLDETLSNQRDMSKGTFAQRLIGGVVGDPVVLAEMAISMTLPGRIGRGATTLSRALTTGAASGVLAGGLELTRQAWLLHADPTAELETAIYSTAGATAFGALLGGTLAVPGIRAEMAAAETYGAFKRLSDFSASLRVDPQYRGNLEQGLPVDLLAEYRPPAERPLSSIRDVPAEIAEREREVARLAASITPAMPDQVAKGVMGRIAELTGELRVRRQELLFRRMDEAGISQDISKIFRPSGAADNPVLMHTPGPLRTVMRSSMPNKAKLQFLKLMDSTGIQMRLHEYGITLGPSVEGLVRTDFGNAAAMLDDVDVLYRQRFNLGEQGSSIFSGRDVNLESMAKRPSGEDFDSWINEVNRRRILGEEQPGALEKAAEARITKYFDDWEAKLVDEGLLHTKKLLNRRITKIKARVAELEDEIASGRVVDAVNRPRIVRLQDEIAKNEALILNRQALQGRYGSEAFFPRRWNTSAIKSRRSEFEAILRQHYMDNPEVWEWVPDPAGGSGSWELKKLSTRPEDVDKRVKHTIDGILGKRDAIAADSVDAIELAAANQKARTVGYRQLDIPNSKVIDFIDTGVRSGVREYNGRVARKYRFAQKFGRLEDALNQLEEAMDGASVAEKQHARMLFQRLYNRISGRVLEDPTAINQKVAQFLRDSASFAYLGSAGFAAVADFGKIMAEYASDDLILGIKSAFDKQLRNASVRETRIAGSAAEMAAHTTMARITGDMYMEGGVNAFMEKFRAGFNVLNLLGPVTVAGKLFSGMLSGHRLIESSIKVANGTATRKEIAILARYNIGIEQARKIANMPWERTENGLILPNTEAWGRYAPAMYNGKRYDIRIVSESDADMTSRVINGQYQPLVSTRYFDGLNQTELRQIEDEVSNGNYGELARADESLKGERAVRYIEAREKIKTGDLEAETIRVYELSEAQLIDLYGALANVNVIEIDTMRALVETTIRSAVGIHRGHAGGTIPGDIYLDTAVARTTYDTTMRMASRMKNDPAYRRDQYDLAASGDQGAIHMTHFYENMDKIENVEDFIDFVFFHEVAHGIKTSDAWVFANKTTAEKEIAADALGLQMFSARKSKLFKEELTAHFRAKQMLELEDYSVGEIQIDRDYIEANVWPAKPWANPPAGVKPLPADAFADVDEYVQFLALREVVRIDKGIGERPTPRQADLLNREAMAALRNTEKGGLDIVETFRSAIEAEGSSSVIAASAGERPLMMDGVLHVREGNPLALFGHADPTTPGYVRIENGLIGLPLQFYSFAFAAVNKVTGQFMQNSVRNRTMGLVAMLALGYMVTKSRTPDFVWEKMPAQDRFLKAFDQSGVAALYSDAFYTLMQLGNTGFGVNISGGMFGPRFKEDPNVADAITGITGASSGWALGMGRAAYNVATGNFGEGASDFIDNMYGQNLWFLKNDLNQLSRAMRN